ncbi:MAG TPA: hypothetical protein PK668_21515 [Myxococcota bacterium]|nr:hypothetical protein [Myxococcota bacterium]HRY96056.1 hypothetical protein [Myxococcota bacterium]HSA23302.1 hypothetical protein [Myxococcota bacterium]
MPRRLYADKLLGHSNPDCVIPGCGARMHSTGWLEQYGELHPAWYMEFLCPEHGPQLSGGGRWQALIDAVLADTGGRLR